MSEHGNVVREVKVVAVMWAVLVAIMVVFTVAVSVNVYGEGYGTYSKGVRVGRVEKFGMKGFINKSGEGYMTLGINSSNAYIRIGDSKKKLVNPWYFSIHKRKEDLIKKLEESQGSYRVIGYNQARVKSGLTGDTEYEVTSVDEIQAKVEKPCVAADYIKGSKSNSSIVGRIVKASTKGTIAGTNEIMMQVGDSGDNFKELSITGDDMMSCVMDYVMAGQRVKVSYSESVFNMRVFSRNTAYDIVKVEPIDKVSGMN